MTSRDLAALFAGLDTLCEKAARGADADGAALALVTRRAHTRELAYASDDLAAQVDELQFTLGEGPCTHAYLYDEPQFHPSLDDVQHTSQWPTFATEITQLGVHSLFAFPVPGALRPTGVLELYRHSPSSLTSTQQAAARGCAVAIGQRLRTNWDEHLARSSSTEDAIYTAATATHDGIDGPFARTQIHVAAGMLAIQLKAPPDEALDRLRAYSYACGRRISSVAADLIAHRLSLGDRSGR